jgi:L-2-hydroxyglutarate oxidase LhgO
MRFAADGDETIGMNQADCTIIGAGVIGLAVARALAGAGHEVLILEREEHFGSQTSSRNSEVVHAGIYYAANSLKARTCVAGRNLLLNYCRDRNIEYRQCGKFIVASSEQQVGELHALLAAARRNGVFDLQYMDGPEAISHEPRLACVAALSSPSTAILDSHAYMLSLLADAEASGAVIAYGADVSSLRPTSGGIALALAGDPEPVLRSRTVINAAGLTAARVAASVADFPSKHIPQMHYAKGSYFGFTGRAPFSRLIYPVPEPGGLGIHMTLDLGARARFGPDVEWVSGIDYAVDPTRAGKFYPAIRRYWPGLPDGGLQAGYAGIRPKLSGPGEPAADFLVSDSSQHGIDGVAPESMVVQRLSKNERLNTVLE